MTYLSRAAVDDERGAMAAAAMTIKNARTRYVLQKAYGGGLWECRDVRRDLGDQVILSGATKAEVWGALLAKLALQEAEQGEELDRWGQRA